jgi:hypothetical protein
MKGAPVVVVSGEHVKRPERRKQLLHLLVLLVGGVIGNVAGHQHRVGLWAHGTNSLDRRGEPEYGLVVEPVGPDVRVTQLREEERGPAGHASS